MLAAGCGIALDDFGTGHSSLSYLSRLPVDERKIDRTFVNGVDDNPAHALILKSAVDLSHDLGLRVVAEGVENEEVLAALTTWLATRAAITV
jgi:EAL domain-containing protein (putative c-di-GMP-specific phosphodiesterase class I)